MTGWLLLAGIAVAVTVLMVWVRHWNPRGPVGECETCGQPTRKPHTITDTFDDDDPAAGTSISATFCPDDCPGGCDKEHTNAART